MLRHLSNTIIRVLFSVVFGGIFSYFVYFVSPLFSTLHIHCLYSRKREKRKKGTKFYFKEAEEEKDKEQEVFQGEIKTAFVFIQQKVVNYEKKSPMIDSENVYTTYIRCGKSSGTDIKSSYRIT